MITKWNDKEVTNAVKSGAAGAIEKACNWVETDAKRLVHVVTTRLRGSTTHEVEGLVGRVGTNVEYGRRYDMGFTGVDSLGRKYHQAPRAYLRVALENNRNKILGLFKNIVK